MGDSIPIFSSSRTYNFCAVHTHCDLHPHPLSNTAIVRTDQRITAKMHSSIMIVAPFVAAAYAQSSAPANGTEGAMTSSSSYSYSNDATQYLTQTDSRGVITGQPAAATSQPSPPAGASTQPQVATVPAALPTGINTIAYGNESSFLVSVGSSTTSVIGGNGVQTDASVVEGTTGGLASATTLTTSSSDSDASETSGSSSSSSTSSSDSDSNDSDSDSDSDSSSSASSTSEDSSASGTASSSAADSSSSDSAASNLPLASAGLVGLGALFAALL